MAPAQSPRKSTEVTTCRLNEPVSPRKSMEPVPVARDRSESIDAPRPTTPPLLTNLPDLSKLNQSVNESSDTVSISSSAPNTPHDGSTSANTTPRESTSASASRSSSCSYISTSTISTTPRENTSTTPREHQQPKNTTPRGSGVFPTRDSPVKQQQHHPDEAAGQSTNADEVPHIVIPEPPAKPPSKSKSRIKKTLGLLSPLLKVTKTTASSNTPTATASTALHVFPTSNASDADAGDSEHDEEDSSFGENDSDGQTTHAHELPARAHTPVPNSGTSPGLAQRSEVVGPPAQTQAQAQRTDAREKLTLSDSPEISHRDRQEPIIVHNHGTFCLSIPFYI